MFVTFYKMLVLYLFGKHNIYTDKHKFKIDKYGHFVKLFKK